MHVLVSVKHVEIGMMVRSKKGRLGMRNRFVVVGLIVGGNHGRQLETII